MCHVTNFNGGPAMRMFYPADAMSCYKITELMANVDGACYQRALRADLKVLYKNEETFEVGGLRISAAEVPTDGEFTVSVRVLPP